MDKEFETPCNDLFDSLHPENPKNEIRQNHDTHNKKQNNNKYNSLITPLSKWNLKDHNENFNKELNVIKYGYDDIRYGNIDLYMNKITEELIMTKNHKIDSELDKTRDIKRTTLRKNLNHGLILECKDYMIKTEDYWCFQMQYFHTYYEYLPITVADVNRIRLQKHHPYSLKDILQILFDIIDICSYMQNKQFSHGLIRPEFIAYDGIGHYVLCDHMKDGDMIQINQDDNLDSRQHYQHPKLWQLSCNQTEGVRFDNKANKKLLPNEYKADVFSFGLVQLEICLLGNVNFRSFKIHNRDFGTLDFQIIYDSLNIVRENFTEAPIIFESLSKMLNRSDSEILDWCQQKESLPKRFEVQEYLTNIPESHQVFNVNAEIQKERNFKVKCQSIKRIDLPIFKQFNTNIKLRHTNDRSFIVDVNEHTENVNLYDMKNSGTDNDHIYTNQDSSFRMLNNNKNMKNSYMSNSQIDTPLFPPTFFKKETQQVKNQFKHVPRPNNKAYESSEAQKNKQTIENTTYHTNTRSNGVISQNTGQNNPVISFYQKNPTHKRHLTQDLDYHSSDYNLSSNKRKPIENSKTYIPIKSSQYNSQVLNNSFTNSPMSGRIQYGSPKTGVHFKNKQFENKFMGDLNIINNSYSLNQNIISNPAKFSGSNHK